MPAIQNNSSTIKWLGGVGGITKSDQVSLNHVATALVELSEFLIDKAQNNLQKGGNVASGGISSSIVIGPVETNATKMSLDVMINSEYKFINSGVKGVESGKGKYAFKTKFANKKMALAILKWIKVRRVVSKYKAHSAISDNLNGKNKGATEKKNKAVKALSDAATSQKALAYAIATNIKKRGIKPTYFFSGKPYSAVEATKKEQKKRYAKAFKLDIIENLKN